ncbi:hypothetical protein SCALM49S_02212 [Streptomyces californicus]
MKSGKAAGGVPFSIPASGTRVRESSVTWTSTRSTLSPCPGSAPWPEGDDSAGSAGFSGAGEAGAPDFAEAPVAGSADVTGLLGAVAPVARRGADAGAAAPAESHIWAGGDRKTVCPSPSTAARLPEPPLRTSRPEVSIPSVSFLSRGSAAASGVLTTRTCWKLSTVAVTLRSTSGSTSA